MRELVREPLFYARMVLVIDDAQNTQWANHPNRSIGMPTRIKHTIEGY